jgi:hypothetical protein
VLCVVRQRSLGGADHSSRGALASVGFVTECDRDTSIMRQSWPTRGRRATGKIVYSVKNAQKCRSSIPLTVIFTQAAPRPAYNDRCGPLPKRVGHPCTNISLIH